MGIYRERKRAIFRAYVRELGFYEALDVYNYFSSNYKKSTCQVCGAPVDEYSEWHETGYEYKRCSNGCWSINTQSFDVKYSAKNFHERVNTNIFYDEERTPQKEYEDVLRRFNQIIEKERKRMKRLRDLTYRKKG